MSALVKPVDFPFVEEAAALFSVFVVMSANAAPVRAIVETISVVIRVFIMLSPAFNVYLGLVHYKFGSLSDNLQFKQNKDFHNAP